MSFVYGAVFNYKTRLSQWLNYRVSFALYVRILLKEFSKIKPAKCTSYEEVMDLSILRKLAC